MSLNKHKYNGRVLLTDYTNTWILRWLERDGWERGAFDFEGSGTWKMVRRHADLIYTVRVPGSRWPHERITRKEWGPFIHGVHTAYALMGREVPIFDKHTSRNTTGRGWFKAKPQP